MIKDRIFLKNNIIRFSSLKSDFCCFIWASLQICWEWINNETIALLNNRQSFVMKGLDFPIGYKIGIFLIVVMSLQALRDLSAAVAFPRLKSF